MSRYWPWDVRLVACELSDDEFDPFECFDQFPPAAQARKKTRSGKLYHSAVNSENTEPRPQTATSSAYTAKQQKSYLAGGNGNSKLRYDQLDAQYFHSLQWETPDQCSHSSYKTAFMR